MVKSLEEHSPPSGGPGVIFDGNILDTKITQKIGSINRDGRLQRPIQFMTVATHLGKVPTERALQILDQLVRNSSRIEDSTEFICNAVENPDVAMQGLNNRNMQSAFGGGGFGGGGFGSGGNFENMALAHPSAGSESGAFNMNPSEGGPPRSGFKQVLCRYFEKGCQKGDACHFAHGLHELRNPVIAAAGDSVTKEAVDHSVRTAIARCNKHPQITQSIHFKQVAPVLVMLEVPVALALLEELYSIIPTIKNPTSWLSAAATRKATGEERPASSKGAGKGKGKGGKGAGWGDGWGDDSWEAMSQMFSAFLDSWGKGDGKGGKDAGWGNNGFDKGWGKGGKEGKGIKGGGYGSGCHALAQQWTFENMKDLIGKTIGYYNKQGDLLTPINYAELCPLLLQLEPEQARSVLSSIEGKQQSIGNPTKWLAKAAMKYAQGPPPMAGMGGELQPQAFPPAPAFAPEAASFGF